MLLEVLDFGAFLLLAQLSLGSFEIQLLELSLQLPVLLREMFQAARLFGAEALHLSGQLILVLLLFI